MTATINPFQPGAPVKHHDAQAAGIGKLSLLLQHRSREQRSSFATSRWNDLRHSIFFGQLVPATSDFLKSFASAGKLHHEATGLWVALSFV
jgi:hypothetical protein